MPTRFQGSSKQTRALNTYIALMRAHEQVNHRLNSAIAKAGLTVSQFGVLEAIFHLGPCCQKTLGQKILKSSGNITMVVDNLEKRNLVRRERDLKDRRFIQVHLTGQGQEWIKTFFPEHAERVAKQFEPLDAKEQETLRQLCKKLGLALQTTYSGR